MAGRPGRKPAQQPKPIEEFPEDGESFEEDLPALESKLKPKATAPEAKQRDWRDVERYREERALRKLVDSDLDALFDDDAKHR
jgi:hypothetical protein